MNHKQITDLFRENEWNKLTSHKIGVWFKLQKEYEFVTDVGNFIIPRGIHLKFLGKCLASYLFTFDREHEKLGYKISLGRSRLLKMKLKEIPSPCYYCDGPPDYTSDRPNQVEPGKPLLKWVNKVHLNGGQEDV